MKTAPILLLITLLPTTFFCISWDTMAQQSALPPNEPQTMSALKSFKNLDYVAPKAKVTLDDDQTEQRETKESEAVEDQPVDRVGFWLGGGVLLGSGLLEKADIKRDFDADFSIGPVIKLRFLQLHAFRIGLNLGFLHFSHHPTGGNETISISTRYKRLFSVGTVQFHTGFFYLTGLFGAAYTIISTESSLTQNGVTDVSETTGIDPSFLVGLDVGIEFGKNLLHLNREIEMAIESDWTRRGERDTITVMFNVNVEILSTFTD